MPRPKKLSPEAIVESLALHSAWTHNANAIEREFKAANFASALGFVSAVGVLAETADHHPDILIHGWNRVKITLSTHDQGGLTELDFALAAKIDALAFPAYYFPFPRPHVRFATIGLIEISSKYPVPERNVSVRPQK